MTVSRLRLRLRLLESSVIFTDSLLKHYSFFFLKVEFQLIFSFTVLSSHLLRFIVQYWQMKSTLGAVRTQSGPLLSLKADVVPRMTLKFSTITSFDDRRRLSSPVKDRRGPFWTATRELFTCQYCNMIYYLRHDSTSLASRNKEEFLVICSSYSNYSLNVQLIY